MQEAFFWENTPRKIMAIIEQKNEIEKTKAKNLAIYTACYVWGKDPEENKPTDRKKPIPGIDVPAGDISGFFA